MTTYSIIVFRAGASPPDVSRGDIINVDAPWDLVEGLAQLALARYPGADTVQAVDEMGHTIGEWHSSPKTD
jgi:hypothetical protein